MGKFAFVVLQVLDIVLGNDIDIKLVVAVELIADETHLAIIGMVFLTKSLLSTCLCPFLVDETTFFCTSDSPPLADETENDFLAFFTINVLPEFKFPLPMTGLACARLEASLDVKTIVTGPGNKLLLLFFVDCCFDLLEAMIRKVLDGSINSFLI